MGRTGSKIESGMMAAPPATISTTMVSPMARDMPEHDGCTDAGQRGRDDHADQRFPAVAPRASDASRSVRGTANSASSATEQMVGTLMNASMSAAFNRLSPVSAPNQS